MCVCKPSGRHIWRVPHRATLMSQSLVMDYWLDRWLFGCLCLSHAHPPLTERSTSRILASVNSMRCIFKKCLLGRGPPAIGCLSPRRCVVYADVLGPVDDTFVTPSFKRCTYALFRSEGNIRFCVGSTICICRAQRRFTKLHGCKRKRKLKYTYDPIRNCNYS